MIVRVYSISSSKHDPGIEGALSPREALPQPTFDIDSLLSFISKPGDSIGYHISHLTSHIPQRSFAPPTMQQQASMDARVPTSEAAIPEACSHLCEIQSSVYFYFVLGANVNR